MNRSYRLAFVVTAASGTPEVRAAVINSLRPGDSLVATRTVAGGVRFVVDVPGGDPRGSWFRLRDAVRSEVASSVVLAGGRHAPAGTLLVPRPRRPARVGAPTP